MQTVKSSTKSNSSLKNELIRLFEKDDTVRQKVFEITHEKYADRQLTDDRFDKILGELKADREREDKRWSETQKEWKESQQEQDTKWEAYQKEQDAKWEAYRKEQDAKREANRKEWEAYQKEQDAKWEADRKEWNAKWEADRKEWKESQKEQDAKWEAERKEQNTKWETSEKRSDQMLARIDHLIKRHDSQFGALGARWGLHSEASFRNALKAILEDSFNVKVENYEDFDTEGVVHGRPDQIELDVIVYNDSLILCEIKSSMSKSELYTFWRKKEFYEKRNQRKANRVIVISPAVEARAQKVAEKLGVEVYSWWDDVELEK